MCTTRQSRWLLFAALWVITSAGCATFPRVNVAANVSQPALYSAEALRAKSDNELQMIVRETAATARSLLRTDQTLQILRKHRKSLDAAKWGVAGLTGATTIIGTVGSNQDSRKNGYVYGTAIIGAVSTILAALRDDKDVAARIAACQTVAENGNDVVGSYEAYWLAKVANAPPVGDPRRDGFVTALAEAGRETVSTAAKLMTRCH